MNSLQDLQKTTAINLTYYQTCKLISLLNDDIKENETFLSNEKHMAEMDTLNINIRKNMEYSVECAKDLLRQFEITQVTL